MLQTSFSPITTTSPLPPQLGTVQYPSLMSQHQVSQGYHPSLGSMFHRTSPTSNSVLLPSKQPIVPPLGVSDSVDRELKTVSFPRDCLNRFTSIASINTLRNQGACGLLLGKEKGGRYIVTTLLIPKQHATSDAFAMDEEELVIRFTEWRSLITLGWVCRLLFW
jgi:STAM-binding protein